MERIIAVLFAVLMCADAFAVGAGASRGTIGGKGTLSKYIDPQSYAYMYPYMNNQMRTEMNPGTTVSMTNNPIDVVVRTAQMSEPRRVVPRTAKTTARAATTTNSGAQSAPARRVVQRSQKNTARAATTAATRTRVERSARDGDSVRAAATATVQVNESVSYSRCLADYTTCMNRYCVRENTAYNRCYCSAKLSQIDAQYQPQISDLITQIIKIRGGGTWTDDEMNEYWMEKIGNYVGENSWTKLDDALNIDWPQDTERARGQNAFITGHQYCVQHLRACAPMSANLRDAYRSTISRDCAAYEASLERVRNAAQAVIGYYSE